LYLSLRSAEIVNEVNVQDIKEIESLIVEAEKKLLELNEQRERIEKELYALKNQRELLNKETQSTLLPTTYEHKVTNDSSETEKVSLFMSLFRGREDVFARRFESAKSGKSGYQPCCRNEWISGICQKPKVKCNDCDNRDFLPITDEVIRNHLLGREFSKQSTRDFTIGVYPLLMDETCWFLAVDFDKESWMDDVTAFMKTCDVYNVPAILERSRSGTGGHVWIFFSEPVKANLARMLGSFLVTETMDQRPEIGLESYDRFFPSQDTIPQGGFGNLIALPLQKKPREKGNSLFLDKNFTPYEDQWALLSSVRRMKPEEIKTIVDNALRHGDVMGVKTVFTEENESFPWLEPPSRQRKEPPITDHLPERIQLVLGNQIYIQKENLPPSLRNRLIRRAAFQNPEFYRAQAMRLPTYDKPRIIHCCEDFPKHIGLPRGCMEEILELFRSLNIKTELIDERYEGSPIKYSFKGVLREEQILAAEEMLRHDMGVLAASTAFGKTVVAIYLLAKRGVNSLILVHRRQLLDQWVVHLQNFLGIEKSQIGQIGGGKRKPSGIIDVALIQSLSRKGVVDDIVGEYGHLIVDECHHISARSFEIVARQCKAKYLAGLSATVIRKDGHHPIIFMNCGPIRYKVDAKKQAALRPFAHKVITRKTDFKLSDTLENNGRLTIHQIYSELIIHDNRNKMIIEDVLEAVKEKRFPVVLTERREHLEKLVALLSPLVKNVLMFKGGMGQKQRQALMQELKSIPNNEERIICATGRYLGEGFDESRLDTLFLTLPVSWKGIIVQYAGRLHRLHDMKKEVAIYDYVDLDIPMLAKMFKRRLRGYNAMGYEVT
jgi:superfamily II DNA or RNA helicase